jgi:hypothetical protein
MVDLKHQVAEPPFDLANRQRGPFALVAEDDKSFGNIKAFEIGAVLALDLLFDEET